MRVRYRNVHTLHAYSGHREPLAKYLEDGGQLLPCMREFIVAMLRDQKLKKGRPRTFAKKQEDREIGDDIRLYEDLLGLNRSEAIQKYLDDHPDMNSDTLTSILRRCRRDERLLKS